MSEPDRDNENADGPASEADETMADGDGVQRDRARSKRDTLPDFDFDAKPDIQIDGYEIARHVSFGGQAHVYLGVHIATGRKVALKVMREGPYASTKQKARFDREVQILASLDHPGIVKVTDRGHTSDKSFYFAMDYIEGPTLDEWLNNYRQSNPPPDIPADPAELLRVFMKIAEAVNAAHLRGIVHRDLKPANVRIDQRGEPHVLDFGLARSPIPHTTGDDDAPAMMTMTGQFLGSLPWSSPEQAEGIPGKIDTRSDVYALGVVLYQMLTGQFPYEVVGNMRDVLDNIMRAEPTPPSQIIESRLAKRAEKAKRRRTKHNNPINANLEAIVLKALHKKREDRYQTAGGMAKDIANYLAGKPTVASTEQVKPKRKRRGPVHSGHWRKAAGVAALVAIVAITAWSLSNRGASPDKPTNPDVLPVRFIEGDRITPADDWVDLLPLVELPDDIPVGENTWNIEDGRAVTTGASKHPTWLRMPVHVHGDYEVQFSFRWDPLEGRSEGRALMFPVGHRSMSLLYGMGKDGLTTLNLQGSGWHDADNPTRTNVQFEPGKVHDVTARVSVDGLTATIRLEANGKTVVDWTGPASQVVGEPRKMQAHRSALVFATWNSRFEFHRIRMRMLSGEAIHSREVDSTDFTPPWPADRESLTQRDGWVDLLSMLKLPDDIPGGENTWNIEDGRAASTGTSKYPTWLRMPVHLNGDYELQFSFTWHEIPGQTNSGQGLMLPAGRHDFRLFYATMQHYVAALDLKDVSWREFKNPTRVHETGLFDPGQVHQMTVRCTTEGDNATIRMHIDGKLAIDWTGPGSQLVGESKKIEAHRSAPVFSTWNDQFELHEVRLRMLSGEAIRSRSLEDIAGAHPQPAPQDESIDLLALVDPAIDGVVHEDQSDAHHAGRWRKVGDTLEITKGSNAETILFPLRITGSYELTFEAPSTSQFLKSIELILPIGDRRTRVRLNAANRPTPDSWMTYSNESGLNGEKNNPTFVKRGFIDLTQPNHIRARVTHNAKTATVKVTVNDTVAIDWNGPLDVLGETDNGYFNTPGRVRPLGIVCVSGGATFRNLRLRMIDGEAKRLRPDSAPDTGAQPIDLDRDLVGYWKFDEGEGKIARDSSGNEHDGNLSPAVTWVKEGRINGAIRLGKHEKKWAEVNVADSDLLDPSPNMTLAAWVKVDEGEIPGGMVLNKRAVTEYSSTNSYQMHVSGEGVSFGSSGQYAKGNGLKRNRWTHLASVADSGAKEMRVYINGVLVGKTPWTWKPTESKGDFTIGTGNHHLSREMHGLVDDVRVYRQVLSETELAALAQLPAAGPWRTVPIPGEAGLWNDAQIKEQAVEIKQSVIVIPKTATKNGAIRVTYRHQPGAKGQLILRKSDRGAYVLQYDDRGRLTMYRQEPGKDPVRLEVWKPLAAELKGQWLDLEFTAHDDQLTALINRRVAFVNHDAILTEGTVAIGTSEGTAQFKDIAVRTDESR